MSTKQFDRSGVRFQYPTNWSLDVEDVGDGWTATVQSPETAFVLVSLRPDADAPAELADEAAAALRAEYKELDAVAAVESLAGRPAVGYDIDFLTIDTATVCRIRCVDTPAGPLLVLSQVSEYDRGRNDPVLRAVAASLAVEDD
jgi:hypothetical protein